MLKKLTYQEMIRKLLKNLLTFIELEGRVKTKEFQIQ